MNWKKQVDEFKTELVIEPPLISAQAVTLGFFGSVGGGKSVTAGICAIGLTPGGYIGWIDGENKRSGWAIDIVTDMAVKKYGGTKKDWQARFKVLNIQPPFNPLKVISAIEILEEAQCKTTVCDIMSQAWDSEGGYLDLKNEEIDRMAGDDEAKRNRSAASAAAHIKPWTHQKLVNKITSSKTNLILLFQAKQKFNPKTSKPDDFQTPIQESGLTRTAIAVGRVEANVNGEGGYCSFQLPMAQGTKYTHHSILAALPKNDEQFEFRHAEGILKLCGGVPASPMTTPTAPTITPEFKKLKKAFLDLTIEKHQGQIKALEQYLWDEALMDFDKSLSDLSESELRAVYAMTEKKIKGAV